MPEVVVEVEKYAKVTCDKFKMFWKQHNRSASMVLLHHAEFFNNPFKLSVHILNMLPSSSTKAKGRKRLPFEKCSHSTKRKKTASIRENHQTAELVFATQMKLRESGQLHTAKILKEATETTPTRASRIAKSWQVSSNQPMFKYNDAEALALFIDANLSK